MSRKEKILIAAVIAFALLAAAEVSNPSHHLRPCGHQQTFWSRVEQLTGRRLATTHCCTVLNMYQDMNGVGADEESFRQGHGHYTDSVANVTNFLGHRTLYYSFYLTTNNQSWFAAVPAQNQFPGNYLFEGGEYFLRVYFNQHAAATTNDMVLCNL